MEDTTTPVAGNILDTNSSAPTTTESAAPTGGEAASWLPEELKGEKTLGKFKDVASLAKSYIHQEKMLGGSLRIPEADAKPEDVAAFMEKIKPTIPNHMKVDPNDPDSVNAVLAKLGRPESADKYQIDVASPFKIPENLISKFKEQAHALGLTSAQAKGLAEQLIANEQATITEAQNRFNSGKEALMREWKGEFDDKIQSAKTAFGWYESKFPEEAKILKATQGNNPVVIRMLADMHSTMMERGHVQGQGLSIGTSAQAAEIKIRAIKADPNHPFWNPRHVGHKQALQEYDNLSKLAYLKTTQEG